MLCGSGTLEELKQFVTHFEDVIGYIALLIAFILEIFGIIVIAVGAIKAFYNYVRDGVKKTRHNIKIDLGNALALGLEFKMGAEILKTVVVREMTELIILGVIIVLRAILAFLIHWEIKNEKKEAGEVYHEASLINVFKRKKKDKPEVEEKLPEEPKNESIE